MSGDILPESCPTYAVVNIKQKKKKLPKKGEVNSTDIALYAVVDRTKKKKVLSKERYKNYDLNDKTNSESECASSIAVREEESRPTYPVENKSEVVFSTSSSFFSYLGDKYRKSKSLGSFSQLCLILLIITTSLLVLAFVISTGVSYTMISRLRSEITSDRTKASEDSLNEQIITSIQYELKLLRNVTYNSRSNVLELMSQLNDLKVSALIEHVNLIGNAVFGKSMFTPAPSCQIIHFFQPSSRSGYYWVTSSNGASVRVYCEMTKSCGNVTGGLTRVAVLNNKTRSQLCTVDFTISENSRCIRNNPGCSGIVFPMNMTYSHICGTLEGALFGSPDGFTGRSRSSITTINDNYVDGISLTYGNESNRTHIWTFIGDEEVNAPHCPRNVTEFVGSNYSCLKWKGFCSRGPNPCSYKFFRELQRPVSEDIEMRLCQDQSSTDEGIGVENLEIYVW